MFMTSNIKATHLLLLYRGNNNNFICWQIKVAFCLASNLATACSSKNKLISHHNIGCQLVLYLLININVEQSFNLVGDIGIFLFAEWVLIDI